MNVPGFQYGSLCALAAAVAFATWLPANAQIAKETEALRGLDAPTRIEGEYIVVLKEDDVGKYMSDRRESDPERAVAEISQDFAFRYGGRTTFVYGHAIKGFAVSGIDERTAQAISIEPNVAFVETNKKYTLEGVQSPAPWGLDRVDQRYLPLDNSFSYGAAGYGVNAYVVDSGIKSGHAEFGTRLKSVGYTGVSDGYGISDCPTNGHGTHVAGILGGWTYGIAKDAALYSVRVFDCAGYASDATIVGGLNWIVANAITPAVVNLSLIGPVSSSVESSVSTILSRNITVVTAAGNSLDDSCKYTPARMAQTTSTINVANSTNTDARNPSSSWGRCVTLFAPGTNITSAGASSTTATAVMTGTSMSAPLVAGAAAVYLYGNKTATPAAVKNAIVYASTRGVVSNTGSSPNRLLYTGFGQAGGSDPAFTPVPTAPSGLDSLCLNAGGLFKLYWNASSGDVGSYEVWQQSTLVSYVAGTQLNVGVAGGHTNGWKVRACNGAGCSAFSNVHDVPWAPNTMCN